jgi:hydroxylaminobenzene mutase
MTNQGSPAVAHAAADDPSPSVRRATRQQADGHRLLQLGVGLFLLGLFTGFAIPALANPRMALSSHLEAVMNGTFLVVLGLLWPRLALPPRALRVGFWLALYGAYAKWLGTLVAAAWGAGGRFMPMASQGQEGTNFQEAVIGFLLVTLSLAMIACCVLVLLGLRRQTDTPVA